VFKPIPFQACFDTSAFASIYDDLPFHSGCLDSKKEDGSGPSMYFSRLHDPEAMLQFLFACNDLLSNDSDDYSSDKGYNPTRSAFTWGMRSMTMGTILACLWRTMPWHHPSTLGSQESRVSLRPRGESHSPPRPASRAACQARGRTVVATIALASSRAGSGV
jgi:hypothetical protein